MGDWAACLVITHVTLVIPGVIMVLVAVVIPRIMPIALVVSRWCVVRSIRSSSSSGRRFLSVRILMVQLRRHGC
jgi:hypothetical protein